MASGAKIISETLVGFGASTMQGVGDSQGGFFKRIQRPLRAVYPSLTFVNHGIGGDTTREMLARADKTVAAGKYDLVVILGCNDMPRGQADDNPRHRIAIETYEANLATLLPRIRGVSSLFISSFPAAVVPRETFDRYMTAAVRVAKDSGYAIWDLYHDLRDTDLRPLWAPDGVHFNDAGHELIAEGVVARLSG